MTFVTVTNSSMSSPDSDTRTQVESLFNDRPTFSCSKCSAVLVGQCIISPSIALTAQYVAIQALQDELISKSFSGRDGRGLYVFKGLF